LIPSVLARWPRARSGDLLLRKLGFTELVSANPLDRVSTVDRLP
jgi:hypothetical protein